MAYQDPQAANVERRRRTNRNTLIAVGAIIGAICLCGGCGAVFGNDGEPEAPATPLTTTRMTTTSPSTTRPATTTPTPSTTLIPGPATSSALPTVQEPTTQAPAAVEPSPTPPPPPEPEPEPEPMPVPTLDAPAPPPAPPVSYKNCAAVRAAGAAPIYSGQPGYGQHLDRDGDGVGCEN
ncbi:excalibur calcium-binding domain-containing protein [Nocardia carnea]|uniref:excalibur calcium-binding domain-containing protein n=1 Tax=Nocardia carnea TaxID=37328 RepID=UPI0024586BA3|nr:excalibur calcium-binding domain-containing protein [Nocardia carnea]